MRRDLGKIITEAGKSGGHPTRTRHRGNMAPLEDRPKREGKGSKHRGGDSKGQKWNLQVFKRIFKSNVGRKWDDLNSEIRASLNSSNYEQMRQYEWGCQHYVNTHISEVRKIDGQNVPIDSKEDAVYSDYWVHPVTRILMAPVLRPRRPKPVYAPKYIEVKGKFYRVCYPKIKPGDEIGDEGSLPEGNWFEIELVEMEGHLEGWRWNEKFVLDGPPLFPVYDHVLGDRLHTASDALSLHGRYAYAKSKRQLSGAEIRKLGLADKFAGVKPRAVF